MISTRALPISISLAVAGLLTGGAVLAARPKSAIEPVPPIFAELASATEVFLGILRPE